MYKKAYTLGELIIVLIIVGVLAVTLLSVIKGDAFKKKADLVRGFKAAEVFNQAAQNILLSDEKRCPERTFIVEAGNNYAKGLLYCSKSDGTESCSPVSSSEEALNIFGDYIKFESPNLTLKVCEEGKNCFDITGAKISGDIYAGIILLDSIQDCPAYYRPGSTEQITPDDKCWAKLFVSSTASGTGTMWEDTFEFGMNKDGVIY